MQEGCHAELGVPDACGELPGLYAREAGCEQEFIVSNCFTLASMSQAFPGKHLKRFKLSLPIITCVHNLLLEKKNVQLTVM